MRIDNRVEKMVREVVAAVITQDAGRMESAIRSFPNDQALTEGVRLAAAISLYVLGDQLGSSPSEERLLQIAREIAASEGWADIKADEVMSYLTAALGGISFEEVLPAERFAVLTYVIAGCLISFFHRPEEKWWIYLDRAEAGLEAA
jgi:hypothetical protein